MFQTKYSYSKAKLFYCKASVHYLTLRHIISYISSDTIFRTMRTKPISQIIDPIMAQPWSTTSTGSVLLSTTPPT